MGKVEYAKKGFVYVMVPEKSQNLLGRFKIDLIDIILIIKKLQNQLQEQKENMEELEKYKQEYNILQEKFDDQIQEFSEMKTQIQMQQTKARQFTIKVNIFSIIKIA